MEGSHLPKPEIKQRLVDALETYVEWHSNIDETGRKPFYMHLKPPLPSQVRFYLYNLADSGREGEYKINLRLPSDSKWTNEDGASYVTPDRSGGYVVMLGGYHEGSDVFVFWDDDLYNQYSANNPSIQVQEETLEKARSEGFAIQHRRSGQGGETVIAAGSELVPDAVEMRGRLLRHRQILNDLPLEDWRSSSKRAHTIERIVDIVLTDTDPDQPMHVRRQEAVERVADEQAVNLSTVERKIGHDLWTDEDPGERGYQRSYFDPVLREIEEIVASESQPTDHPLLNHAAGQQSETSVYLYSAAPDMWLSSVRYNALPFTENQRDLWNDLNPDDIVLFHTQPDASMIDIDSLASGIIGGTIIGTKDENDEDWWAEEQSGDASYPLIVRFERVFYTGNTGSIEMEVTVSDIDDSMMESESAALTDSLLSEDQVTDLTGVGFPLGTPLLELASGTGPKELGGAFTVIERLIGFLDESPAVNIHARFSGDVPDTVFEHLYLPNQEENIQQQLQAALRAGKHIVLTGPPGTGKTEIAQGVAEMLAEDYPWQFSGSQVTTATADWSTFDTVGGYMPDEQTDGDEALSFSPGILLNRFKNDTTGQQRNEPIVIDELNRADIDKSFGQLFTVLSGQSVQLPYSRDGKELEVITADSLSGSAARHQYVVPSSWRILATMNTYDKTSLYEMSYAFMRRFSFIPVNSPFEYGVYDDDDLLDLMSKYAAEWDGSPTDDQLLVVGQVWKKTNMAVENRAIGPAIVKDILENVTQYPNDQMEVALTNAVINYIFPQLEGVPERLKIVKNILDTEVEEDRLKSAAGDILEVTIEEDDNE